RPGSGDLVVHLERFRDGRNQRAGPRGRRRVPAAQPVHRGGQELLHQLHQHAGREHQPDPDPLAARFRGQVLTLASTRGDILMNPTGTSRALAVTLATLVLSCAIALPAFAQSTTPTSTSTTTSTTLLPHPFSKATRQCIATAHADSKACTGDEATCKK